VNFLADAQARADFVALLARLGHDTITVQSLGLHLEPDEHLVAEARARGRIFLSFDNFRGETGRRVAIEIHRSSTRVSANSSRITSPPTRKVAPRPASAAAARRRRNSRISHSATAPEEAASADPPRASL
jgi:hypothetical protein